ncbi:MAG: hypothetical protein ACTS7I_00520 [Candidatus Hodgkinia cicadicola]
MSFAKTFAQCLINFATSSTFTQNNKRTNEHVSSNIVEVATSKCGIRR